MSERIDLANAALLDLLTLVSGSESDGEDEAEAD